MADILISYAREDRFHAERLANALDPTFAVWWDVESLRTGSESFNRAIQRALEQAKCVVVLWSSTSVNSAYVESEAYWAWQHKKLHSVRLDDALSLPVPFTTSHARSLARWDGSADFSEFRRLMEDIEVVVGRREPAVMPSSAAQQETTQRPPEPTRLPPAPIEQPRQPERSAEPEADDAAAPAPPPQPHSPSLARLSLIGGVVGVIAVIVTAVYLSQREPQPEPDTPDKVAVAPDVYATPKSEDVPGSARKRLEAFRDCPDCPEMVVIPAGEFQMGCVSGKGCAKFELPVHAVTFDQPFAIGKYELTFAEYDRFAEATGAEKPNDSGWGRGRRPVINVSWQNAAAYAKWLAKDTGKPYRLPTEAEWEYAARGATATVNWWGDEVQEGGKVWASCGGCGSEWDGKQTAPVGSFPANPYGLRDTAGNVWEWVEDCWHGDYTGAPEDGSPWQQADGGDCGRRVVRGGAWNGYPRALRSANRLWYYTVSRGDNLGFRLAQDL